MKKITTFVILSFFAAISARATVLFHDTLNYPNGLIETDGLWYAYTPATPHLDAFVTSHLLILNQTNYDGVAAPSNNFTNPPGNTLIYASFTINVSTLPTAKGGYFANFKDTTNDYVGHVFIATTNTVVPGTYQLGIDNFATASSAASFFPLDLATGITYQVVINYDDEPYGNGAFLWVNPASTNDTPASSVDTDVYGTDTTTNLLLQDIVISQIAFSQYTDQGVAAIGNVIVGTTFGDVLTNTPQIPVIGINPQSTNLYSNDNITLYVAASGLGQLGYRWLSNGVPLSDGTYVSGSSANVLTLSYLQNTANYSAVVSNSAGSVTSAVAVVAINTTPTPPFFITQPYGATNSLGSTITLSAVANGTGPLSYYWYFEATNGGSPVALSSGSRLVLANVTFTESGYYYVTVTGGAAPPTNSVTVPVLVVPPPSVLISYLHNLMQTNNSGSYNIVNSSGVSTFNVQGVVTTFGPCSSNSKTYGEYYIQDSTAGIYVYFGGQGSNGVPAAGTLVSVTGPVAVYDGQLEIEPVAGSTNGAVSVISTNNPLPAPQMLNFSLMATNPLGAYGNQIQDALVTVTNVYIYSSTAGAPVSGTFYANGYTDLYMTEGPYNSTTNAHTIDMYILNYAGVETNFTGKLEPGQAYQLTGPMSLYNGGGEIVLTRYADFVTNQPAPFVAGLTVSNGVSQLTWPVATGSTYSVYSATNLLGPWTQTFGLGYYPSAGIYTVTNSAAARFYKVSTP
jgi:hypothetical protein